MTRQPPVIPPYEKIVRDFLETRDTDLDAQAVVFNLDHTALDVLSTLEGIALRPHDLTHAGFVLLMTLWITGPRETRELAAALRVTKGAIVGAVDTLERRGLVERERSNVDRRLVAVRLTDRGTELIARVQKHWHALEREVTRDLSEREQRMLAALCRKVARSARRLRRDRANGTTATRLPDPERFMAAAEAPPVSTGR
jgi:DNA-binding MarR family transcriptional regulator